jgi:hypothetical protein
VRAHRAIAVVRRSASQPAQMRPPPLCAAQLSLSFHLGSAPLGFTGVHTGALVGPPCKPRLPRRAICHGERVCTWRACVHMACVRAHGVRACTACVRAPRVRACTGHACVHTACVHTACVRARGMHEFTRRACILRVCVRACVHTSCVCACTRSATPCVRAHGVRACVHTACVHTAQGVHDACAHTTVCLRAHGVDACIHPARSPWCIGRCFSATTAWRARVHTACTRAYGVRACTQRAFAHTARVCTRRACVHTAIIDCAQVAATAPLSSQPAQMLPLPLCAAQLSLSFHLGSAPLGFTQGPWSGPRVNPDFRAVLSVTENVSAHDVRACTWRACVYGVRACARHACVCLPASRYVSVSYGLSDSLHTACVRACVHRACMRSHGARASTLRTFVRACTRRAYVRAHCVHTECGAVRAFTWCVCVRSYGVCACVHTACVHTAWMRASIQRRRRGAQVAALAPPPHGVCACTRRTCVHTVCVRAHGVPSRTRHVRAHGMRVCTRRSLVYPSSAVSIVCRSLLQCHHHRSLLRCCRMPLCAIVCSSAGVYTGALVGPPCKPRLPRCATCHRDAVAVASCTLRQQSGPASTDAGIPCSCCNRIRDLVAVIDPLCCRGAPALPPFCAAC